MLVIEYCNPQYLFFFFFLKHLFKWWIQLWLFPWDHPGLELCVALSQQHCLLSAQIRSPAGPHTFPELSNMSPWLSLSYYSTGLSHWQRRHMCVALFPSLSASTYVETALCFHWSPVKKKKKCLFNLSLCCCLDPLIIPLSSIMEQAFICESVIESQRTYWITHVLIPDSRIKLHALCNCHHACSASPSVCAVKRNPPCILIKYTAVSQYYLPFGFILTWIRISQTHTWTHFQMSTNPWMWAKWENNPPRIWSA